MALLKRLRGKKTGGPPTGAGAQQMKMLRRLPKILRFIPGTAQDVRAYFLTLQYWLAGSADNIVGMVRFLVDRYADGPRRALRGAGKATPPVEYPEVGVYHPRLAGRIGERRPMPCPAPAASGTVGLLVMRSYVLAGNTAHYDGVIAALEARGLRVIPAFATGLDARPAIEKFFLRRRPAAGRRRGLAHRLLAGRRPCLQRRAAPPRRCWPGSTCPTSPSPRSSSRPSSSGRSRDRGLLPVEVDHDGGHPGARRRHRPDGVRRPLGAGRRARSRTTCSRHLERADMLAARVARLVALRRTARAERKVAIVLFNFPPNAGNTGTAAYLGVFESLLQHAQGAGRRRLQGRGPGLGRRAAHRGSSTATRRASARTPTSMSASRSTIMCAASAGSREIEAPVGPGPRPAAERRRLDLRAGRAVRQRLRRRAARLRLRGRPDAAPVREGLRADPRLLGLLPLPARGFRRRRRAAFRHPRRARVHARQAGRHVGRLLAGPADRRPAEPLPLRRQQSVRGHASPSGARRRR